MDERRLLFFVLAQLLLGVAFWSCFGMLFVPKSYRTFLTATCGLVGGWCLGEMLH